MLAKYTEDELCEIKTSTHHFGDSGSTVGITSSDLKHEMASFTFADAEKERIVASISKTSHERVSKINTIGWWIISGSFCHLFRDEKLNKMRYDNWPNDIMSNRDMRTNGNLY